jgi:hypothetical protein
LKATRNHHVVDLKLKKSYASLLKKSSLVCEQHTYCDVEYFCVDHDELCWCSVHSGHNSSSQSIHQLTDELVILRIWQGSHISGVAIVNSIIIK